MRFQAENGGKILGLLLFFLLSSVSCDKEQNSIIPYVPVSISLNLNIYNELSVPGNSIFLPGPGFAGIIVYCEMPGSYTAYDAACTYEISPTCRVVNDGVQGTCSCCGSQFILMGGGYPTKGPAAKPLQQYHTSVVNGSLRIYN
ncbi:MAG TPA: hypothetical protein PK167_02055 [Prolixibacteraceae bacterium]|nr:hypothetical protein [Prolixibacteraceae bacterium]